MAAYIGILLHNFGYNYNSIKPNQSGEFLVIYDLNNQILLEIFRFALSINILWLTCLNRFENLKVGLWFLYENLIWTQLIV